MEQLLLLGICFVVGLILGKARRFGDAGPRALNAFIIHVSLPALVLLRLHSLAFDRTLIVPILTPWILFFLGAALFYLLGARLGLAGRTIGCLMLVGGLGNTSFMGLPMIEAMYGRHALAYGILVDQPGTFLILSTFGMAIAARYAGGDSGWRAVVRRVLLFPPFIAFVLSLPLLPISYPDAIAGVLGRLADTLAPLALVSVGLQLATTRLAGNAGNLLLGLSYKMVLAPIILLVILYAVVGTGALSVQVSLFEAAMPPMITAGIVAIENDLDPPLAALMVGVGVPVAFLTLPLWHAVLARL
ncbi:MAG: AEC family transporter [Bacteroidetes bacterium]|nr:AEC family transporter [Bacteroidota bacterium]